MISIKKYMRALCALLLLLLCASVIFSSVSAAENNYSYPSATAVKEIYADEFLETFVGVTLSDVERAYLKTQSGFLLSYNSAIPTSCVTADLSGDTLTVSAKAYTYTAENGVCVVWTPQRVTLGSREAPLSAPSYTATLDNVGAAESSVTVSYTAEFVISEAAVAALLNTDVEALKLEIAEKRSEYESESEQYRADLAAYNQYLAELAVYNEYLAAKNIYDAEYAEYTAYLAELAKYEAAYAEYEAYEAARDKYHKDLALYEKYCAYAEKNLAQIEAYEKYREKLDTVNTQLNVIKKTKTPVTSLKRTVYGAVMGDTVTSVIENKDVIANNLTEVDPKVIERAGTATTNLRALLTDFFELQSTQDQYSYYITNYDGFCDNFCELLRTLDELYMNPKVRGMLVAQEKQEKYVILLAQLYYVANALSDEPVINYDGTAYFDGTYVIGKGYNDAKSPSAVITDGDYMPDTDNAAPLEEGYPVQIEKPEYTYMTEPVMPSVVACPIAPDAVVCPTAPAAVAVPVKVKKPGREPKPYTVPEETAALISAYENGTLSQRGEYVGGDITVTDVITVAKRFRDCETVTVKYYSAEYNSDGEQHLLYTVTVDKGTCADYLGPLPEKDEDAEYIYTHCGWTDANGAPVDLTSVFGDISLYPAFSAEEKEYETVWVVNGETFFENPGTALVPNTEYFGYGFSRWERSVDPLTSDVTYTAVFETPLVPTSVGAARVSYSSGMFTVELSSVESYYDISALLSLAKGRGGITLKLARGGRITLPYSEISALAECGAARITSSAVERSGGGYAYSVTLTAADGSKISSEAKIKFTAPCNITDGTHLVVYGRENGEKNFVGATLSDGCVTFNARSGVTYYANVEYSLTAAPLDAVEIKLDKVTAASGERVTVALSAMGGIRIDRAYFTDASGAKTEIADGSFEMPSCDVTVGVEYTVLQYTVTFVSDGRTVASFTCSYGDTVTPPQVPKKAATEKYTYTFVGWSDEIVPVTESRSYTAVWQEVPIDEENKGGLQIAEGVLKLLLVIFSVIGVSALGLIPSAVITAVLLIRRKMRSVKRHGRR